MQNKILLIALTICVIAIVGLSWKVNSASSSGSDGDIVSLNTDPNPLHPGSGTLIFNVKDKSNKQIDNATISFDLNMTTMNMGTQQGAASSVGEGNYSAPVRISMSGPWRASARISLPDGSVINKDFFINVP